MSLKDRVYSYFGQIEDIAPDLLSVSDFLRIVVAGIARDIVGRALRKLLKRRPKGVVLKAQPVGANVGISKPTLLQNSA